MTTVTAAAALNMPDNEWSVKHARQDDLLTGSSGDDHLMGYRGNDTFDLSQGGQDIAEGGAGGDTFLMGAALSAGDRIFGGSGSDTLVLNGATNFTFAAGSLTSVEKIVLESGAEYQLRFDPATIAPKGLHIDGHALGTHDNMSVAMTAATTKSLYVIGGHSEDTLTGSDGNDVLNGRDGYDTITGGGGADILDGGPHADCYHYHAASDSTGLAYDTVRGFDPLDGDMFVVSVPFDHLNPAITTGHLDAGTFDADLAATIDTAGELGLYDAVLFTADSGSMTGKTFLVVDFNNVVGYQAGGDLVILLDAPVGLAALGDANFIGA